MKLAPKTLLAIPCIAMVWLTATTTGLRAQNAPVDAGTVPIQSIPPVQAPEARIEQYRVIDISTIPMTNARGGAAGTLEAVLNELASQGWKLREAVGNYLVFAR